MNGSCLQMKLDDFGMKRAERAIDSAEKLQRKREAARIRQQRCRARKRAAAAAASEVKSSNSRKFHTLDCSEEDQLLDHCIQDTSPIAKRVRSMIPTPTTSSGAQQQRGMIMTTPVNTSHTGYCNGYSPSSNATPHPFHGASVTVGPSKGAAPHHPYYMAWYPPPHPGIPGPWMMPPPHPGYHIPHPIPRSTSHNTVAESKKKETPPLVGSQSYTPMVPPVTVSATPKSSTPKPAFSPFASPLFPTPLSSNRASMGPMDHSKNTSTLPAATPIKPSKELELEEHDSGNASL